MLPVSVIAGGVVVLWLDILLVGMSGTKTYKKMLTIQHHPA
jgi:hypothetical protein